MNKVVIAAILLSFVVSNTALAQTKNDQNILNTINKDNASIQKHNADLQRNRDAKTTDKMTKSYGSQTLDSSKIGAGKTTIEENKTEKSIDQKILAHHKKMLRERNNNINL